MRERSLACHQEGTVGLYGEVSFSKKRARAANMDFDAEDVEELNARRRDQRQPAG